ncbi:MAG: hypothetical protein C0418_01170 [Coriobacteriaceae bacterium]|nr:hypothetical protein [Coriobacteriaceae bacterium]
MRPRSLIASLAGAIVLLWAAGASPAFATLGVGSNIGRIELTEKLSPGGAYELPAVAISNTGDEQAYYTFMMVPTQGATRSPDPAWFTFEPRTFALQPGKVETVRIHLALPRNVEAGRYEAILGAKPSRSAKGALVNIGAGARLTMEIDRGNVFTYVWGRGLALMARYSPWSYFAVLALLAMVAAVVVAVRGGRRAPGDGDDHEPYSETSRAAVPDEEV